MTAPQAFGAAAGYSVFYVPADEELLATVLEDLQNNDPPTRDTHALVAVTAWADNTIVYIDHWEDGYEFDPDDPSDFDESYTLAQGGAQKFETSNIALNRTADPSQECVEDPTATADPNDRICPCDGRDIIYAAGGSATVTRAGWLEQGNTYQSVAWEVYPVRPQLIKYILPFGEDLNAAGLNDFERVYAFVQATNNNTIIQIDFDADGTYDSFDHDYDGTLDGSQYVLNKGDVYLLTRDSDGVGGTLNTGTTILGSETIQVQYIIGDQGSNYEVRGLSAFPRGFWDNEYYAPVDDATANDTDIFIYNPHSTPLTINWETAGGAGNFTVGANTTEAFNAQTGAQVPNNGAVYLRADDVFWGVSTIDTEGQGNDWGYSLVPASLLDKEYYMGWAPAYDFSQATAPQALDEQCGLFITAAQDNIVVWIDEDNDGTIDQTLNIDRLNTTYVTASDTGSLDDDDLSQARILSTGPYALAYGQNPDTAVPGDTTALDLGYTVLPTSDKWFELVLDVEKDVNPVMLSANTISLQTATFTLEINTYEYSVDGLTVTDSLPANWRYVAGNTTVNLPDGSTVTDATADDGILDNATGDITWSGTDVFSTYGTTMGENQTITIEYMVETDNSFSTGFLSLNEVAVVGTRTVEGVTQTFTASDFEFVTYGDSVVSVDKTSDVDPVAYPGDTVEYTFTMSHDGGTQAHNDVQIYDPTPYGTTYVAGSSALVLSQWEDLQDDFTGNYGTDSTDIGGTQDWTGIWAETDAYGGGAASGAVSVNSEQLLFAFDSSSATVEDAFTTNGVYTGDDGSQSWTDGSWTENDILGGDAASGLAQVTGSVFQFAQYNNSETVEDEFTTNDVYTGDDGSQSWTDGSWTEVNDDTSAASGVAQVDGGVFEFAVQTNAETVLDQFTTNDVYTGDDGTQSWIDASWTEVNDDLSAASGVAQVDGGVFQIAVQTNPETVADEFSTGDYTGDDGSQSWQDASWTEVNDDASAASGVAQVTGNALQFAATAAGDNVRDEFTSNGVYTGDEGSDNWSDASWFETDAYGENDNSGPTGGFVSVNNNELEFTYLLSTVRDEFGTDNSYAINDGSDDWQASWVENDNNGGGAGGGYIEVDQDRLEFHDNIPAANYVYRQADVLGATSVAVSLDWDDISVEADDQVGVYWADNLGGPWTNLWFLDGTVADGTYTDTITWTSTDQNIYLLFYVTDAFGGRGGDEAAIDNVEIEYNVPSDASGTLVVREADLSGETNATLTFYFDSVNLEATDDLIVEASAGGAGGTFTTLATYDSADAAGTKTIDLDSYITLSATTAIQFRVSAGVNATDESFYIDDVDITYGTAAAATNALVYRETSDLSNAEVATLTFTYSGDAQNDSGDTVVVEASSTGAPFAWGTVATYDGITTSGNNASINLISPVDYATATTHIRFRVSAGFTEADESFTIDNIQIAYDEPIAATTVSIEREPADLSNSGSTARLSFDYTGDADNDGPGDTVEVQVSSTGLSGSWATVGTYTNIISTTETGSGNIDISGYTSTGNTHIRFEVTSGFENLGESFTIDDVQIVYTETTPATDAYIEREVANLANATTATLSFDYTGSGLSGGGDTVVAEVSDDGADPWTVVGTYTDISGSFSASNINISGEADTNTHVRFRVSSGYTAAGETFTIDNVVIAYTENVAATGAYIEREVTNLFNATTATLSFDYTGSGLSGGGDTVVTEVSDDGAAPWTIVGTFADISGSGSSGNLNIISEASANTHVRFRVSSGFDTSGETFTINNVVIGYTVSGSAGSFIQRETVDLSSGTITGVSLNFDYTGDADLESGDTIVAEASDDGVSYTVVGTYDGTTAATPTNSGNIDISAYASANTHIQFRVFSGFDNTGETFSIDNVDVDYTYTVTSDDPAGDPPNFVPNNNYDLSARRTLTLTYEVTVDDPFPIDAGSQITNTACATSTATSIPLCADVTDEVVVPSPDGATIGNRVWLDSNANGKLDVGESGISGVVLVLKDANGFEVGRTTTDANGFYLFSDVPSGTGYFVEIESGLPSNVTQTTHGRSDNRSNPFGIAPAGTYEDNFGSGSYTNSDNSLNWVGNEWMENDAGDTGDDASTGDIQVTGGVLQINGASGTGNYVERSFSIPVGAATTTLSFDWSTTGVEAADDITLEIRTYEGEWDELAVDSFTGLTGANSGSVTNLDISAYQSVNTTIRFRVNAGYSEADDIFTVDNVAIDYSGYSTYETSYLDEDFGYLPDSGTAIIGDRVWSDADGDGLQDAGEPGLEGVAVRLYTDAAGDGIRNETAVTVIDGRLDIDGDGTIETNGDDDGSFAGYTVIDGYLDIDGDGTADGSDADDDYDNVGGYEVINGALDIDGDGTIETGSTDDDGSAEPYRETTTAAGGFYLFTGVPASGTEDYLVWTDYTQATGYTITTTDIFSLMDVEDGYSYPNNDFGFEPDAGSLYTITDRVWIDQVAYGSDDITAGDNSESGIVGVTVDLLDASSNIIATTTTDSNGEFQFAGMPSGIRYSWQITDTAGKLSNYFSTTAEAAAGEYQLPGNLAGSVDFTDELATDLTGSEDPNFGYNISRSIGDTVYNDLNGDGGLDAGEPGLGGVTVSLYRDENNDGLLDVGDTFVVSEVTDGDGKYLFAGLTDDDYIVSVGSSPIGYEYTTEGPPNNTDDDPAAGHQQASNITGGSSDLDRDFGYQVPAASAVDISGTVWGDEDEGGTLNGSENGIPGVTVQLLDSTGTMVIQNVTTGTDGTYSFGSIPNNTTYIVRVTDDSVVLNGYSPTYEKTEGMQDGTKIYNDQETVMVTTADITDIDFGYYKEVVVTRAVIVEFGAYTENGKVVVRWQTASEHGTVGFYLYRLNTNTGQYKAVNNKLLPGLLHSPTGGSYSYEDKVAKTNAYYTYRLEELEISGKRIAYGPWQVYTGTVFSGENDVVELDAHASIVGYRNAAQPLSDEKIARLTARMDARLSAYADKLARKGGQAKIHVAEDGLYFIDANDIATVLDISVKRVTRQIKFNNVRLRCMGQNVAVLPAVDNSGLYFYGERCETRYSNENVYWLYIDKGLQMRSVNRAPKKEAEDLQYFYQWVWEEEDNLLETVIIDDPQDDHWMWGYVFPGYVDQFATNISTPGVVAVDEATLTVTLQGAMNAIDGNDHHAVIRVNGIEVGDARWDGFDSTVISVPVAIEILNDGDNLVEVVGIKGAGLNIFYINHIQMVYPRTYAVYDNQLTAENNGYKSICMDGFTDSDIRVFEITNPRRPLALAKTAIEPSATGIGNFKVSFQAGTILRRYLAVTPDMIKPCTLIANQPSYLKKRFNLGDYVIITSSEMMEAAQGLADYRSSQGHKSKVVDVEDIYDEFSNGIVDAEAIREFLAYAYSKWRIPPQYVLLAGEGSFDYLDNMGFGDSVVPTLMTGTPDGLIVTDFPYADVAGNDWIPEFAIGRIPVISADELVDYTNKVIGYETSVGAWTQQAIFAADPADNGGDFIASSDEVAGLFPETFSIDRLYQDRMTDARAKMISGINEGRAYVNFFGHGAIHLIGNNNLFSNNEIGQLFNGDLLPVVTAMTCSAGNFGYPGYDAITENMVLKDNGGAIAMWAPSGFAFNDNSLELCKGFYGAVFIDGETVLGDAIRRAQEGYAKQGDKQYHVDLYNLMGDPALKLK